MMVLMRQLGPGGVGTSLCEFKLFAWYVSLDSLSWWFGVRDPVRYVCSVGFCSVEVWVSRVCSVSSVPRHRGVLVGFVPGVFRCRGELGRDGWGNS